MNRGDWLTFIVTAAALVAIGVAALLLAVPHVEAAGFRQCGVASWYSYGTRTASGARFNPDGLSAAMFGVPFGTRVRVTDMASGRSVVVTVNDTGGFRRLGRLIDLSRGAAARLGMLDRGLARVCITTP